MVTLLTTREVAAYIGVNEKMVYSLVAEKGLPASKITGKWLFPRHLVDQWIEANTINYPDSPVKRIPETGLLMVVGSNDPLLEQVISWFNKNYPEYIAVFGNLGSMGGLKALREDRCHMAGSHLMEEDGSEYNFSHADRELGRMPAVVNFCRREQGLLVAKDNPKQIQSFADLQQPGIRVVNRGPETGTRLLFDRILEKAGIAGTSLAGYDHDVNRNMDVGTEILAGRADAGPGIRAVAHLLGLDFIPLRWERYDLLITKNHFFDRPVQAFLSVLHDPALARLSGNWPGYDTSLSGKMVFPA
jgi:putative molybdopterin biosynthesis protein